MRSVCVFCGSNDGKRPLYRDVAAMVARALVARGVRIVYGGGRVGCMGALADAALAAGGEVIGVIPRALEAREVAHHGLSALHVVETMHERKALMAANADAFLTLAGGFGTLEELFEAVTWRQLGYHDKPSAILNTDGYFDGLIAFCNTALAEGFVHDADRAALLVGDRVDDVVDALLSTVLDTQRGIEPRLTT
ncbi:MAG: TIGR00730 family Rossman fold protein [Candidatus Eremiobacteraeota bacterium]|nr:TIGR00730 family Rossman fold protein [Candidatus Eremiobacteraeota bacterium]MBC5804375.1 TIGR00730 family Rossman fold protein [Candidatus Eremiobacteraeota bacterium]MBC5820687.1 TIGR00730 family Rossman fold protein [Candidatus Eremiobacteraeota bacterium]